MIIGKNVAKVSDSPVGCTFQSDRYEAYIGNDDYYIYDTVGLNEGDQGRVPHWTAIQGLYTLIRELDGVSLLLHCIRGRIKENTGANWILFKDIICAGEVPVVIVETGLDQNLQGEVCSRLRSKCMELPPWISSALCLFREKTDNIGEYTSGRSNSCENSSSGLTEESRGVGRKTFGSPTFIKKYTPISLYHEDDWNSLVLCGLRSTNLSRRAI